MSGTMFRLAPAAALVALASCATEELEIEALGQRAEVRSDASQRLARQREYAARCVEELGEIPFFQPIPGRPGAYEPYDCMESLPIPMTQTSDAGDLRTWPDAPPLTPTAPRDWQSPTCDAPQYIYGACEPGPRVARRVNAQGTVWVLLCRKNAGGWGSSWFNDIAMIGHDPATGKTYFLQNHLQGYVDGRHVPHPADVRDPDPAALRGDPTTFRPGAEHVQDVWYSQTPQGGLGNGVQCVGCHDADPFIHSPWITAAQQCGARDTERASEAAAALGLDPATTPPAELARAIAERSCPPGETRNPVIPRLGVHSGLGFRLGGALPRPYTLVNQLAQGWRMPRQFDPRPAADGIHGEVYAELLAAWESQHPGETIVPETAQQLDRDARRQASRIAGACVECHRLGNGKWLEPLNLVGSGSYVDRLVGADALFNRRLTPYFRSFLAQHWMPPGLMEGRSRIVGEIRADCGETDAAAHACCTPDDAAAGRCIAWEQSRYGRAIDWILRRCGADQDQLCQYTPTPGDQSAAPR
jgi:hypothetical protein